MKQESRTNINRVKKDISSPDSFTPPEELKRQLITTMQSIYDEEDIEAVEPVSYTHLTLPTTSRV